MATFSQQRDGMVCCPYDNTHRMAARNFVKHTMQCELKYNSGFVVVCPHNASHRMPKHELTHHLKHCEDHKQVIRERSQYTNASDESFGLEKLNINNNSLTQSDDEWNNDNAPHFDIYTSIAVSDPKALKEYETNINENKKTSVVGQCVKETKNQKKRRKRKQNVKTAETKTNGKQINSVWDLND